ncbi:MAG: hypothetical protein A2166_01560, partial [Omnitrophica WOR_2 bacterium RBG_13_41_10]
MKRALKSIILGITGLAISGLVFLGTFASVNELSPKPTGSLVSKLEIKTREDLLAFAEKFLPEAAEGKITQENKAYIYKSFSEEDKPSLDKENNLGQMKFEATFAEDALRLWFKRDDSAFGIGMAAEFFKQFAPAKVKNNRIVYNHLKKKISLVYTPLAEGIREDILVAKAKDLERFNLSWLLELGQYLEAKLQPDGAIAIYGPEQYLSGNIQISDEKSAQLIEKARQNAAKDQLLYQIPLPIVREANGKENKDIASYKLEEKKLTLAVKGYKDLIYPISIDPSIEISTTAEFWSAGNNEGMISSSTADQITREKAIGGAVGSTWSYALSLPTARSRAASVAYNGYLYVTGGYDGSSYSSVQYASISSVDGSLGAWWTTTSFAAARYSHNSVAYNGYLYVMGGTDKDGFFMSNIQYASISSVDGSLGAWWTTTSLTTARTQLDSVAYNGYLYVTGGYDGTDTLTSVEYAPVNADGSIGSWVTSPNSFTTPRSAHSSVAYNGYLYVIGGDTSYEASPTSETSSVEYASISSDGSIGTWTTTTTLSGLRAYYASVAYNGYLYVMGGWDGSSYLSSVQCAPINSNGSLGSWQAATFLTTARGLHSSVAYNGYLYVIGGSGAFVISTVQYASINDIQGALGSWAIISSFPTIRSLHSSVAYNGYLYVIGGYAGVSDITFSSIEYAPINADGSLGSWSSTTSLTTGRYSPASVAYNGYLYVMGGWNGTNAISNVEYAPIYYDGTIGSWLPTSPLVVARRLHSSVAYNGYLYVTGGTLSSVEYAPINANGTVESWLPTTTLPESLSQNASVAYNGYLYVLGGTSSNDVYYNSINTDGSLGATWFATTDLPLASTTGNFAVAYNGYLYLIDGGSTTGRVDYAPIQSSGALGSWVSTNSLLLPRRFHSSVAYNGYLYVTGGIVDGTYSSTVEYAPIIKRGGTLGSWNTTTSLVSSTSSIAAVAYNGYLYVTGGNYLAPRDWVDIASINSNGTLGSHNNSSVFNDNRCNHASVVYNGYLYVLGGWDTSSLYSSVEYALINSDGSVGPTWSYTTSLTTARRRFAAVAYNDYLYVIGGNTGVFESGSNSISTVQYVSINSNGSLGSPWSYATSLPKAISFHDSVAYNGYLYVIGGIDEDENYLADVRYASIDATTHAVGNWSSTTYLPLGISNHSAVAADGYLYVIGGKDSEDRNVYDDIFYAPINADGTLGSWVWGNTFSTARYDHDSVAYNGYLYVIGGADSGGNSIANIQYAPLKTPAQKGYYSRLIDLDAEKQIKSLVMDWTTANKGTVKLEYRYAPVGSVSFTTGGSVNEVTRGSAVSFGSSYGGLLGRYLWLRATLDDTNAAAAVNPDVANERDVTDITVVYSDAVPTAPSDCLIQATPPEANKHRINWADSSSDEYGFEINRSINGSAWASCSGSSCTSCASPSIPCSWTLAQNSNSADDTSLTANTKYYYRVASYKTDGVSWSYSWADASNNPRYTLSPEPDVSEASASQKVINTWYNTAFNFQNDLTWSIGGIDSYGYVWTTTAPYSWNAVDKTDWTTGNITPTVSGETQYYLYVRSYNGNGVETTSATWSSGPWKYDIVAPTAPTAVSFTPVGGTVVSNTLNTTNTNW